MKKIKTLFVILMTMFCINSVYSQSVYGSFNIDNAYVHSMTDNWSETGYYGMTVGVEDGIYLADSQLVFNYGCEFVWKHKSFTDDYDNGIFNEKQNIYQLRCPVALGYEFVLPQSQVTIQPYIGLGLKFNVYAEDHYYDDWDGYDYKVNLFTDLDGYNRVQLDWQVGLDFNINNLIVGMKYVHDLSSFYNYDLDNYKYGGLNIKLGYRF